DGFKVLAPSQIRMHHATLYGSGTYDGNLNHQVVELLWPESGQHAHLSTRFDLEHTDCVSIADHFKSAFIVPRDVIQREGQATALADQFQTALQGAEHAQCENIYLHDVHGFQIIFFPL